MPDFSNSAALMTPADIYLAKERGRLKAAENITANPEARQRVEAKYGVEFCRRRWPEAYTSTALSFSAVMSEFLRKTFGVGSFRGNKRAN